METIVTLLSILLPVIFLIRLLLMPLRLGWKLASHCLCGFLCLWLLSSLSAFTGIVLPINGITVLIAGFGGIPGIGLIALLELAA